jgi:hypothetical protein
MCIGSQRRDLVAKSALRQVAGTSTIADDLAGFEDLEICSAPHESIQETGRAALLRRLDIRAAQQRNPTENRFMATIRLERGNAQLNDQSPLPLIWKKWEPNHIFCGRPVFSSTCLIHF